jgi:hypothetical protein
LESAGHSPMIEVWLPEARQRPGQPEPSGLRAQALRPDSPGRPELRVHQRTGVQSTAVCVMRSRHSPRVGVEVGCQKLVENCVVPASWRVLTPLVVLEALPSVCRVATCPAHGAWAAGCRRVFVCPRGAGPAAGPARDEDPLRSAARMYYERGPALGGARHQTSRCPPSQAAKQGQNWTRTGKKDARTETTRGEHRGNKQKQGKQKNGHERTIAQKGPKHSRTWSETGKREYAIRVLVVEGALVAGKGPFGQ